MKFRHKFLWLVYDHIRSNPTKLNDRFELSCELMDAGSVTTESGRSLTAHFMIVAEDAIGCLLEKGLIDYKPMRGYRVSVDLNQSDFEAKFNTAPSNP